MRRILLTITLGAAGACARADRPDRPPVMPAAVCGAPAVQCEPWDIGTGVAGRVWRAPRPRGSILLLHGYGHYAEQYLDGNAQLIPRLLDMGLNVYAFDMWGNGRSPGIRGATDVAKTVDDHLAARRRLAQDSASARLPIFLIGHSVGGLVTLTSVLRDSSRVNGVIVLSPTITAASGFPRVALAVGSALAPAALIPGPGANVDLLTAAPEARERLRRDTLYFRRVSWLTAASGSSIARDNWQRYREIRAPLLVLHGDADSTAIGGSQALVDGVGSSDKTYKVIRGGRHLLLDDTDAAAVRQTILDWIEARLR